MATTIVTKIGNLFDVKSGHIVHGCNAQGVMGSGVALGVKNLYPSAYTHYMNVHENGGLQLGTAYFVPQAGNMAIWNAITQGNFGPGQRQTSYDAVQTCFQMINDQISMGLEGMQYNQANEIHIPLIGAVRGGGKWPIIKAIIEDTMDYPVTLWMPDETVTFSR